ncbi:hypothetical protein ACWFMI_25140 [Nocardiopsis terrae]|uniref:hypothetical protein n=1 Tax=Streptomyces sp. NPDC057554 TaxID=3350538 RepID=UPI0036B53D64
MQNLIDALADYTMAAKDVRRGDTLVEEVIPDLWERVSRLARPQGLTAGQALRAYYRR